MTLFFEFLQVTMGNRKSLSVGITDTDWLRLFEFCNKQALIGVGFTAVEKLHAVGVVCPAALRMRWMALALQIERQNEKITKQCRELTKKYEHDGLQCCILKGQGNLQNYPEELRMRRMPGDVDVWCIPPKDGLDIAVATGNKDVEYVKYRGVNAVIEYARMQFRLCGIDKQPRAIYHHIDAPAIDGTEVEIHYKPSFCRSLIRNRRMRKWFAVHAYECTKHKCRYGFPVPTSSVNVVYQMCHLFNHFFHEGIGLRQLMDYYYTLKIWHNDLEEKIELESRGMLIEGHGSAVMSPSEVMEVLRSFGMARFAGAVMWVLNEVFENEECRMKNEECIENEECRMKNEECSEADDMGEQQLFTHCKFKEEFIKLKQVSSIGQQLKEKYVCEPWMICEPNEKEGKKLLEEIMKGGNFGQYDNRDAALKNGGMVKHGVWKLKRVMRLVRSYPEEALWEPVFRVWHLGWRTIHG